MRRRGFVGFVAVIISLFMASGVMAAPAYAATCKGSTCEGKDPQAAGCSGDAVTLTSVRYDQLFEMRYSRVCDAVWTRVVSDQTYSTLFMAIRSYYYSSYARKNVYGAQVLEGTHWTRMVAYGGQWTKSCAAWGSGSKDPVACTGYR